MSLLQTVRIALRALLRNKLRSFLTALGIIIGVAAVIAMVAFGQGAKANVEATFAAMGTNMLIVMSGTTTAGGAHGGFGSMPTLTWGDLKAIQTQLPAVRYAAPALRTTAQVLSEEQNWTTSVTGTTDDYFAIRQWPAAQGRLFTVSDEDGGAKVVVLGQTVVDQLYGPGAHPVGKVVRISNVPFEVVGVLVRKGQSPMGQDYDDGVFVPESTFRAKIQGGLSNFISGVIIVGATSQDATDRAQAEISDLLRDRHHLADGTAPDFDVHNLAEIASASQQGMRSLTLLLASIAFVSLVVGGIGIMNIMLVSVTERTREIGLRMAIGAKPRDVLMQFLVEALALSTTGGLAGVAIGLGAGFWGSQRLGWPLVVQPAVIAIAVGFSGVVGVIFGLYPAYKASRLDPIEALRYE
ncbi:MAG: ABC transporter permease [Myxococcales bacterium]